MKKNTLLTSLLMLLMLTILLFPELSIASAQKGLLLWFNKVLPSLLPFMIFINILVPLDGLRKLTTLSTPFTQKVWHLSGYSFFAFIMGLIAGYPMGAKVIKQLYQEQKLTKEEAELTLCFSNNCGPLFIIGTIGTTMLSSRQIGYFLFFIHLSSALLMSLLITRVNILPPPTVEHSSPPLAPYSFSTLLNKGVMNAMDTIVCVGGYIILFSVLTTLLTETPLVTTCMNFLYPSSINQPIFAALIASLFELSNGSYHLSHLPLSIYTLAGISSTVAFGGFCVYFQTLYVLEDNQLSAKPYFIAKVLQGLLSFGLTLLFYPVYVLYTENTSTLFTANNLLLGFSILALVIFLMIVFFHPYKKSIFSKSHRQLS